MDDASSVFDASILTGPIANYPVADSFNRTLERDYSTGDIPLTIGSASRNPVRGPSYRYLDMALMRRIPVRAGQAIEVRAEAFNLLNTTNLGTPNGVLGAANFGTITAAFDPRVVQVALKFVF